LLGPQRQWARATASRFALAIAFFEKMSFRAEMSGIASADSFFSFAFYCAIERSRLVYHTSSAPNLAFHL
jgi:hypothetical protein